MLSLFFLSVSFVSHSFPLTYHCSSPPLLLSLSLFAILFSLTSKAGVFSSFDALCVALGTRVEWNHDTTLMCICPCTCSSSALIIVATVVFPACVSVATKDTINHGLRTSESLSELISRPNLCVDHRRWIVLFYNMRCVNVKFRAQGHTRTQVTVTGWWQVLKCSVRVAQVGRSQLHRDIYLKVAKVSTASPAGEANSCPFNISHHHKLKTNMSK